ncbi:MAG: class I SAM-dependent methyltransferase [Promethearchaeota archaeon]
MREINYDKFSQIYDLSRGINSETLKDLIRLTDINSNSIILDIGCGTGNYTHALKNFAKYVIGLDLSLGMIQKAKDKFPNLEYINSNAIFLPFNSEIFHGIYAIQVFHHIRNQLLFLKEAYNILRTNGHIVIHTCSHDQINTFWYYYYFPEGLKKDFKRIPDIKEIISLLKKTGFSNIGVKVCYDRVILNHAPENYLDKNYRNGDSTFALLTDDEIELGCKNLQKDIKSGDIIRIIKKYKKKADFFGSSSIIHGEKV